jgi:hypothetical protein
MSVVVKKILVLSLALVLSFTFWGCAGGQLTKESEFSQQEIDQIVASTIAANATINTARFDMNMPMTMEVTGGSQPGKMTMAAGATGAMDIADEEMQMTLNMTMGISGQATQKMTEEIYIAGAWIYVKVSITGQDDQWMKMQLTEEMWQQQNQIEQQIEFLKTAIKVNYLGSEAVSGTNCYVFEIVPSMETLGSLLSQQASGTTGIDFSQLNLAKLIKTMSVKEWIARDSYLLMKAQVDIVMEMRPADVGATSSDFNKMTMDMNVGVSLHDYNQPVSVTLPPEALNAQEVSGS